MLVTENVTPEYEYVRLKILSDLDLDYADLQEEFRSFTSLAAGISGTEISLINLLDSYTQWTISYHGNEIKQIPREDSVCQYTIREKGHLEVMDLAKDYRFRDKPYVAGNGGLELSYYMGVPLTMSSGETIGVLCVLDKDQKQLPPEKVEQLKQIAGQVVKQLELKLELKRTSSRISDLIQTVKKLAHDVRGPINGIKGVSDLAISENSGLLEMRSYLQMIAKSSDGLLDLTNDILEGKTSFELECQDLIKIKDLAEKVKCLYEPQATPKNISLEVDYKTAESDLLVPRENLLQIIGNLISNGIKFTPPYGEVKLKLALDNSQPARTLRIKVEDTGNGFSREKIRNILNGQGLPSMGSAGEIGFGLGLKLVKEMVEGMNGSLSIPEAEYSGGKFLVVLPVN